jgi:hydrocephalus-inducing protein
MPVEFLPLKPGESTTKVQITSTELGVYHYDLRLLSTPVGPERSLHFKVGLGSNQVQTFRFLSFSKQKTEYACRIDSAEFSVEKSIIAPSGMRKH